MGKYVKKKSHKKRNGIILAVIVLGLLAALPVFLRFPRSNPQGTTPEAETTIPSAQNPTGQNPPEQSAKEQSTAAESTGNAVMPSEPEETAAGYVPGEALSLPLLLGGGELQLESLFSFEGPNPDCGNLEGTNTAAVLIKNISGRYLESATIWITLRDGSKLKFSVSDLPAGKEVFAFSVDHAQLEDGFECMEVEAEPVFADVQTPEGITASAEWNAVTVTNNSGKEVTQIEIYCHGIFGETYYGGVPYVCEIAKLSPGESATITVTECMLGMVEVARIVIH